MTSQALRIGLLALLAPGLLAVPVAGQEARGGSATSVSPSVDVDALPISLVRIRRGLDRPAGPDALDLELNFYIDVYGRAEPLDVIGEFDVSSSAPIQYGGMTHREFMQHVTPREFQSPAINLSSVVFGLSKWLSDRARERRAEAERRRAEAAARALRARPPR